MLHKVYYKVSLYNKVRHRCESLKEGLGWNLFNYNAGGVDPCEALFSGHLWPKIHNQETDQCKSDHMNNMIWTIAHDALVQSS